jgi:hypothetical protein
MKSAPHKVFYAFVLLKGQLAATQLSRQTAVYLMRVHSYFVFGESCDWPVAVRIYVTSKKYCNRIPGFIIISWYVLRIYIKDNHVSIEQHRNTAFTMK